MSVPGPLLSRRSRSWRDDAAQAPRPPSEWAFFRNLCICVVLFGRAWPTGSWAVPETAPPGDSPASPGRPAETRSRASSELLLDVPDPEDSGWDFLASLGVVVSPDLDAFLSRLRQLCHQATTKAQVEAVYHQLERFGAADHVDKIRRAFATDKVVFVPTTVDDAESAGRWTTLDACVWSGPDCLEETPRLDRFYKPLKRLFATTLECSEANLTNLVLEARSLEQGGSPQSVAAVFAAISRHLESDKTGSQEGAGRSAVAQLGDARIFPTRRGLGPDGPWVLRKALVQDEWYIPDDPRTAGVFGDRLDFLAIDYTPWHRLCDLLGLRPRLMTSVAKPDARAEGADESSRFDEQYIRERMRYVAALIPMDLTDRRERTDGLKSIPVLRATKVFITWTVEQKSSGGRIQATEEASKACLTPGDEGLCLYLMPPDLEIRQCLFDVTTELQRFCRIEDRRHSALLMYMLLQSPLDIEEKLRQEQVEFEPAGGQYTAWSCGAGAQDGSLSPREPLSTGFVEPGDHSRYWPSSASRPHMGFMNMDHGWVKPSPPMTIFYGDDSQDTKYYGELYVSRYLARLLGPDVYRPEDHWTSPLRSRNGLPQYKARSSKTSAFTVTDIKGEPRDAMIRHGNMDSHALADVITAHVQMLRVHLGVDESDGNKAQDVYILARVHRVWDEPAIAMYADQGQLVSMALEAAKGSWRGGIDKAAPAFKTLASDDTASDEKETNVYEGLAVGPGKIRLLKLDLVDDHDQPLRGSLETFDVDTLGRVDFWAISYVWGPRVPGPSPWTLTTERGAVSVTESLSSCLKCLRRKRVEARIWADAVCINQQDKEEKSIQVRRLGSLYSRAARVIVWLGGDDAHVHVRQPLCDVGGRCPTGRAGPEADTALLPDQDDEGWKGISQFLKRPWFTRAWVVQELALGSKHRVVVVSGQSEMRWDCMMETLLRCGRQLDRRTGAGDAASYLESWAAASALHRTRRIYHDEHRKFKFLQLLEMFAYTQSSRPRDKMFSLLNLAVEPYLTENYFDPDYTSPDAAVMGRYARGFVRHGAALELLYHAGHAKSYRAGDAPGPRESTPFCSWIPDFMGLRLKPPSSSSSSRIYPPTISTWRTRGGGGSFRAGPPGEPAARVSGSAEGSALVVRGCIIGHVLGRHELDLGTNNCITFVKALEKTRHLFSTLDSFPDVDGEDGLDGPDVDGDQATSNARRDKLLLRLLVGDASGPQTQTGPSWAAESFDPDGRKQECKPWPPGTGVDVLDIKMDQDAHVYGTKSAAAQRRAVEYWATAAVFASRIPDAGLCTASVGAVTHGGLVPGEARVGDHIFIATGAKVPFVLREVGHECYRLVGECYVHGIMYGPSPGIGEGGDVSIL
ncbi:hypothetical protein G6O67_005599 [Ophiocordyceps sinensis]|uniref:Heterokaryon incompatibility domain-containing protein n=1 Tax=Ophiocordyceps sinensis TaxID=72228 RepID=A0A8H4PRU8_9HYPO|nr:hypothetical protein G6O67_005599 [Ophiocordyceps sinensis]